MVTVQAGECDCYGGCMDSDPVLCPRYQVSSLMSPIVLLTFSRPNRPDAWPDCSVLASLPPPLLLHRYFINCVPRASSIARCQRRPSAHDDAAAAPSDRKSATARERACVTHRCSRHKALISPMCTDYRSIPGPRLLT